MNPAHEAQDDMADYGARLHTNEGGLRLDTHRVMSCTGPCDQGRKSCPCPADCQRAEEDEPGTDARMFLQLLVMSVLSVLVCMALIHWLVAA